MKLIKTTILAALLGFSGQALAMPLVPCDAGIANNVTSTSGCALGSTNNDFLNPLQVNIDEMFGYDDWSFGQKGFDTDMSLDLGLTVGGTINGAWTIDNIWTSFDSAMLVFKGGFGNNTVSTYVAYLLDFGSISGTYLSPFANPNNGNLKDISHVSIYVRNGTTAVSEPASFVLFALGIAMIGFRNRRRT